MKLKEFTKQLSISDLLTFNSSLYLSLWQTFGARLTITCYLKSHWLSTLCTSKISPEPRASSHFVSQHPPPAIIMFCTRCLRSSALRRSQPILRQFSTTPAFRNAEPQLSTPVTAPGEAPKDVPAARSSCAPGTVLNGLNYIKTGQDPVAKHDDEYPEWLWSCLDVLKKSADSAETDAGDEFCMSIHYMTSIYVLITPC
jgi:hypothetical protein